MSCTTDRLLCPVSRRGSILMEFVLVLPIYMALLGGLFLIGDIGLNAIRVSTGDRDAAMDAGDRGGHSSGVFSLLQMGEEASKVASVGGTLRAEAGFSGAWSWFAAGRARFAYEIQSWGGALLSYPYLSNGGMVSRGGVLDSLIGGGSVLFHSKDFSLGGEVRSYNYYTLKRTDLAHDPNAYRNWDSQEESYPAKSRLVDSSGSRQQWYRNVFEEYYAPADADKLDSGGQDGDSLPDSGEGRGEYRRFKSFVEWSQ